MAITFLSWRLLGIFCGAVGLTVIIVQLIKLPLDKVLKVPTRYLVYTVCFLIMLAAQLFTGVGLSIGMIAVTAVNAALGTLTAMALHERAIEMPEWEKLNAAYEYLHNEAEGASTCEEDEPEEENQVAPEPDNDQNEGA